MGKTGAWITIGILVLCAVFVGGCSVFKETLTSTVHGTITDTFIKQSGNNGNQKYLISVQKDNGSTEVFEDTDSWVYLKFNSSDTYEKLRQLQQDRTPVTLTVFGVRAGLLSSYRNIVGIEEGK